MAFRPEGVLNEGNHACTYGGTYKGQKITIKRIPANIKGSRKMAIQ